MNKIAAFNNTTAALTDAEVWNTRFGKSARVVKRTKTGQFVTNLSARQLSREAQVGR